MLKLMKYEVRRQLFSKIIMLASLFVLVAGFFIFYLLGNEAGAGVMVGFLGVETMVVVFYAPLECLMTFDKDLNTKQGYLLFLIPEKSTVILGAKLLVSLVQTVALCGIFFTVVPWLERLADAKFETNMGVIKEIGVALEETMEVKIIGVIAVLLLIWLFLVCLGFFVSALPLQLGKLGNVAKVAGFFVGIGLIVFVLTVVEGIVWGITYSNGAIRVCDWVYMAGVSIALFFGTAKLLEEKVSV